MGKKFDFQYLVLGGGAAGSAVATTLAKFKKKVAIVDDKMTDRAAQKLTKNGIVVICGRGRLKNQHTITVLSQDFSAEFLIIATGRQIQNPAVDGIDAVNYLTIENVLRLRKMPRTALVIGGGADGCRAAGRLARGGTKVALAELTSRLLPKEEVEVGAVLQDYLKKDLGAVILTGTRVNQVSCDKDKNYEISFTSNNHEKKVKVNAVVLATEKTPSVNIGLEKAGVKFNKGGIKVDKSLRTSAKNIYAVGGVIAGEISRERANYAGTILGRNLAAHGKNLFNYSGFARIIKTFPEIATIGPSESSLKLKKIKYKKAVVKLSETEASERTGFDKGFVKIISNKQGKLIGATIVAPGAEAMMQELVLAMRHQLNVAEIAGTPHPLGEFGAAVKMAAKKLALKK